MFLRVYLCERISNTCKMFLILLNNKENQMAQALHQEEMITQQFLESPLTELQKYKTSQL